MKSSPAPGLADLGRADMETFRPGEVPLSIVTTDGLVKTTHTHTRIQQTTTTTTKEPEENLL